MHRVLTSVCKNLSQVSFFSSTHESKIEKKKSMDKTNHVSLFFSMQIK